MTTMTEVKHTPRVRDNDRDEITVTLDGKEIRGWSYENDAERRTKMLQAREFVEGWFHASDRAADALASLAALTRSDAAYCENEIRITCASHGEAIRTMQSARVNLSKAGA